MFYYRSSATRGQLQRARCGEPVKIWTILFESLEPLTHSNKRGFYAVTSRFFGIYMNTEDDKTQGIASNGGTRAEVRHKMTDTARCIARMSACRRWPRRMRIKGRDCWNSTAAPPTHAGQIADKCAQLLDTTLILRLNPALSSSHPTLKPYSPSRQ